MSSSGRRRSSTQRIAGLAVLALLSALTVPTVAGASHQGAAGPQGDFAVGGGFTGDQRPPFGTQQVGFAAFGGPTTFGPLTPVFGGDPVTGHFRAGGEFLDPQGGNNEVVEFQQEGPVTCLVVEGNKARLVYPLKQAKPEANEANEVLIFLEDNGNPKNGRPTDRIAFALLPDETPTDDPPSEQDNECVAPQSPVMMSTLSRGNITIHDAP